MANEHDSLLREVEEELRRDQMQKLWDRYNGVVIGAAALIVLAVGGYKLLESRRISAAEVAGVEFAAAEKLSDDKKKDEAEKAFATIADTGPAGYAALAKLRIAGAQVRAGKVAEAISTYESLAKQPAADDLLKSFAQLQSASLRMSDADYAEIQNRLTSLAQDDAPFSTSARELLGVAAYKSKKYDEARKYLEPLLIDPNASDAIQDRIKVVMAGIAAAEVAAAPSAAVDQQPKAVTPGVANEPAQSPAKPAAGSGSGAGKKE